MGFQASASELSVAKFGYTEKGFRKIIDRSRAAAKGELVRGPTIKFFQPGKRAPIKFRQEWIDEFIDDNTVEPYPPEETAKTSPTPPALPEGCLNI